MFLVGFALIFIGMVLMVVSSFISGENISIGVIIIVGPIPIIIGSGHDVLFAIIVATILTIFCISLLFFTKCISKKP